MWERRSKNKRAVCQCQAIISSPRAIRQLLQHVKDTRYQAKQKWWKCTQLLCAKGHVITITLPQWQMESRKSIGIYCENWIIRKKHLISIVVSDCGILQFQRQVNEVRSRCPFHQRKVRLMLFLVSFKLALITFW